MAEAVSATRRALERVGGGEEELALELMIRESVGLTPAAARVADALGVLREAEREREREDELAGVEEEGEIDGRLDALRERAVVEGGEAEREVRQVLAVVERERGRERETERGW